MDDPSTEKSIQPALLPCRRLERREPCVKSGSWQQGAPRSNLAYLCIALEKARPSLTHCLDAVGFEDWLWDLLSGCSLMFYLGSVTFLNCILHGKLFLSIKKKKRLK